MCLNSKTIVGAKSKPTKLELHDGLVGKTAIASIWGCRFKSQRGKH